MARRPTAWIIRTAGAAAGWGALAYSLGLLGLSALWLLGASRPWWVAISNIVAVYLFLPLPALLLAALFMRRWPIRAAAGLSLTLFLAQFGAQILPPAPPAEGRPLRALTFNHLYSNRNTDAVVAAIRAQDADIVALQELSTRVAGAIERDLADQYPYQYLLPSPRSYGLGLLSRHPIVSRGPLSRASTQQAVLDIDGARVTVLNVHLPSPRLGFARAERRLPILNSYDPERRERAAPLLLRTIDSIDGPLIALGDFNTAERETLYNELDARLTDAYRATSFGVGATFPVFGRSIHGAHTPPLVRIDYIWSRGGIAPAAAWVSCDYIGADHCMLGAELRLQSPAAQGGGWLPW